MRAYSTDFFVNGKPMLVPDEDVQHNYEDLDDASSGRDESGVMHRVVVQKRQPATEASIVFPGKMPARACGAATALVLSSARRWRCVNNYHSAA